ncbi:MAG: DEAD/DEAH box helicase [Nitrospirae bacterium]|nr:MAG: DEAD/DEAH box helicase [Nitrospirota bacterium]
MLFEDLKIPEPIQQGIKAAGFVYCTPVQAATLPDALSGKDIAAQSQTGTGKTAAFLIAVFSRMLAQQTIKQGHSPRALVIAPTRELVAQIHSEASIIGQFTNFKIVPVFGGMDYNKQRNALQQGVDMIIGTPGRLIDYLKQGVYNLKKTDFLVIDEADRMFDLGFIKDIRFLLRRMPPYLKRQSMLFSATLSYRVMELCYEHMNLPEKISVTPEQITVNKIEQALYHVGNSEKQGLLLGILRREQEGRILIFVNMKVTADKLERLLKANNIKVAVITGDISQKERLNILDRFKNGELPVLVASDVASRGLHIDGVTHVINYDLPQDSEDYVHRIGRTARAGAEGKAISFACEDYVYSLDDIEKYIKEKIPVVPMDDSLIVTDYKQPASKSYRKKPFSASSKQPHKQGTEKRRRPDRTKRK